MPACSLHRTTALLLCFVLLLGGLTGLTGCQPSQPPDPPVVITPPPPPVPPDQPEPATGLRPNEAGKVMVLMYHEIGPKEGDWQRTPDNFRQDLARLWDANYRLVPLQSVLAGRIDLPRGYSPVVLTFDDADAGQFRYIDKDGQRVIDPDCAVGIIEAFAAAHPGFGTAATFYTYFAAAPFRQRDAVADKLRYLVSHGYEIGNHTWGHANLSKLAADAAQSELARQVQAVQAIVPEAQVASLALPYGGKPADVTALLNGQADGVSYRNGGVLLVGAEPAPSPFVTMFKPEAIPRVRGSQSELDKWLTHFAQRPSERYVSDGDLSTVTVPETAAEQLNPSALGTARVVTYRLPQ